MVQTNIQNRLQPGLPAGLLIVALLIVIGLVGLDYHNRPVQSLAQPLIAYELPAVPYNMSVTANGSVEVTVPTDFGMPPPPDCKDYGLLDKCKWHVKWLKKPGSNRYEAIQIRLQAGDNWIMSKVEMIEIDLVEVEQIAGVDMAGHQTGWIAYVQVAQKFLGNGLGRLTWQAGDAALKVWAGANGVDSVVRVIADVAGWGNALMAEVPPDAFLFAEDPIWIYVIQKG